MTTAAPMTSGGIGQPSTAATLALNGVPGKILEQRFPARRRTRDVIERRRGLGRRFLVVCEGMYLAQFCAARRRRRMETMMQPRLALQVQLMSEPCLWRWEIHDRERGEVLETSWTREWMAYESPEEAERAGRQRLIALVR
jgi:hypothetical protein